MSALSNYAKYIIVILLCALLQPMSVSYGAKRVSEQDVELSVKKQETLVGKITLEDVFAKAKEHSYDLKIADYNILISKQDVRGMRSEYFPKLNFGVGTEYTKNYRDIKESTVMSVGDAFINPYTRYQSVMGITVGYNLFDFGVRGGNLKMAKEDVQLKELETMEKLQEMNLTLLDSYTKILLTTKQIEIYESILALQEKNLDYKKRLSDAKEISKTELNDAAVSVKNTKSKISDLKSIRQESVSWLSFYTGENYDADKLKVADIKKSNFNVLENKDYTKSIVWKIHEKNIKKKELELSVAKKMNYPKVNLYGRYYLYGADHNSYNKSLDNIEPSNFTVGASLNMPVFDGFKNSANIEKKKLELKQLQVERDKAIAQLMTKLSVMRSNLIYLDEQIQEGEAAMNELSDKEKSMHKLLSKKLISPIEENDVKIELLNQKIELDKNSVTQIAITRGIEILTEEK